MGNIIVSEFITLDGVIEAPGGEESLGELTDWTAPFFNDEIATFKINDLFAADALLMGRVTYQIHADAWPSVTDETGMADRMNKIQKYVVSATLETAEWHNTRIIRDNIIDTIARIKQETQRNILIDGGSDLVNLLMQHHLIDEYRLLVHPVTLGRGKHLFREGLSNQTLTLVETRTFSTGVVALIYQPVKA
jgi:dihydrofolate reductase